MHLWRLDRISHRKVRCFSILMMLMMVLPGVGYLQAQSTTGDILGTVTDPTDAVVPDATVTVENLGTHEKRIVKSATSGDYAVNLLPPGDYSVTATGNGFKNFTVPSLRLAASDRARVDVHFAIGSESETVTVESQGSELHTDSSVVSNTITEKATQDLPLNGRNFIQLVQLVPGASEGPPDSLTNGTKLDDRRQSASVSINGQSEILNNEMIDGADNNERLIGTVAVRPSLESIAEMNVQTNTYTAEVGRTGGGIVNVITKTGTNQFHGSLFEYFRNDIFNSHTYNFGAKLNKAELRQNQFGGSLGGPIIKDHTFFFGDYEGYRLVQGTAPQTLIVPTAYQEANIGNFSDVGGPVLTPAQIDPVSKAYFQMFPAPNFGSNTFIGGYNNVQYSHSYDARVDHNFNSSNTMYARFTYNNVYTDSPGPFPDVTVQGLKLNPNSIFNALGNAKDIAYNGQSNYIHIFTPNLLLELKAAYTRVNNQSYPETDGLNPNEHFGQPNVNTPISDSTGLAPITVITGASLGSVFFQPLKDQDNTFQYYGTVTYTHGKHSLKTGSSLIRRQLTSFQSGFPEGYWLFLDYPGLLQGQYVSRSTSLQLNTPHLRTWEVSAFVQDDWHVSKALTLNLGLRYDVYTPYTEINNNISTFNPVTGNLQIAGRDGISNTAGIQTDHFGAAPRVGFAYSGPKQIVLRGGYGIGYFPMNTTSNANLKNPPFVSALTSCSYVTCGPGYTTFADGLPVPVPSNIDSAGAQIPDAVDPSYRTSYIQQFNLTVQKEAAGNVFTVTYVGLLGRQLAQVLPDLNAPSPNTCATSDTACYTPLRPYYKQHPNLGTIGFYQSHGSSNYNALQMSAERRTSKGLTLNLNYQLAHSLDNATGLSEEGAGGYAAIPSLVSITEYGNSQLDIRNRIAGTVNYQLPFGKSARGAKGALIGGWQANLIGVWSTGVPFSVTNSSDATGNNPGGSNVDRPDQIADWRISNPGPTKFFNTAAFQAQNNADPTHFAGRIGTERRNQLYGPHYRHLDLSLFKTFAVRENMKLEFRAEGFNITNTSNFAVPNSSLGGSNFGQITALSSAYQPRVFQFALKLNF